LRATFISLVRFISNGMAEIQDSEVSCLLARILFSSYPFFPWPNLPSTWFGIFCSFRVLYFLYSESFCFGGLPRGFPTIRIPCSFRYRRFSRVKYFLTDIDLRSKFNVCLVLSPDHRAYLRLVYIDDPVTAAVHLILVHLHLLGKHVLNDPVNPLVPFIQGEPASCFLFYLIQHFLYRGEIPAQVSKLFPHSFPQNKSLNTRTCHSNLIFLRKSC